MAFTTYIPTSEHRPFSQIYKTNTIPSAILWRASTYLYTSQYQPYTHLADNKQKSLLSWQQYISLAGMYPNVPITRSLTLNLEEPKSLLLLAIHGISSQRLSLIHQPNGIIPPQFGPKALDRLTQCGNSLEHRFHNIRAAWPSSNPHTS